MNLVNLLTSARESILKRWREAIIGMYPKGTALFIRSKRDPFANPVGSSILGATEGLLDGLLRGVAVQDLAGHLDTLVRIRAVQEFYPAQAVGPVFLLKSILRQELAQHPLDRAALDDLLTLESRIDDLALLAFDVFSGCREQLYRMRAEEIVNRTSRLIERANLSHAIPRFDDPRGPGRGQGRGSGQSGPA